MASEEKGTSAGDYHDPESIGALVGRLGHSPWSTAAAPKPKTPRSVSADPGNSCRKTSEASASPSLIYKGVDLPRIPPGDYQAVCIGWQGPQWVRSFRRWSLRLEFSLMTGDGTVSMFLNMGNDPATPEIGRRSRFYMAWSLANGETPRKGQQVSPSTFTEEGLVYLVRVTDSLKDAKDTAKPDAMVYSKISDILSVTRP